MVGVVRGRLTSDCVLRRGKLGLMCNCIRAFTVWGEVRSVKPR